MYSMLKYDAAIFVLKANGFGSSILDGYKDFYRYEIAKRTWNRSVANKPIEVRWTDGGYVCIGRLRGNIRVLEEDVFNLLATKVDDGQKI